MNLTSRITFICLFALFSFTSQAQPRVVISQIYGGAGCGTAGCSTYRNDYIEIFNAGNQPQDISGWSVQYATSVSGTWQITLLPSRTLQPGQFFLIAQGAGANGVNTIPTPDATGTIAMSATAGKVAVVSSSSILSGSCPVSSTIEDLVGYGATPNCNEGGSNAPSPNTINAVFRAGNGCTDVGVNGTDFAVGVANARNSATALAPCATLPVKFKYFQISHNERSKLVKLSWATSSEANASLFEVERSVDGVTWTKIHSVPATGNSNTDQHYTSSDNPVPGSINYYRIRQVDIDGQSIYTGVVSIRTPTASAATIITPNPSDGRVSVRMNLNDPSPVVISVFDINGRMLSTSRKVLGYNQPASLDLRKFGKGTFYIVMENGADRTSEKVVVF